MRLSSSQTAVLRFSRLNAQLATPTSAAVAAERVCAHVIAPGGGGQGWGGEGRRGG